LHDAMPGRYRAAILLGAFAGLRIVEACGLRVADVDFMRGSIAPAVRYPAELLKTGTSPNRYPRSAGPCTRARRSREAVAGHARPHERARGPARAVGTGAGLPGRQSYRGRGCRMLSGTTDLRHYFASLLIASGADVKTVQARLRHASAKATLDTYGHLTPDRDESTKAAVEAAFAARPEESLRNGEVTP